VSTAKKLYDEALKLPERERRDLAQRLLESVGDEPELERAWVEVAQGRLEDVRAGRTQLVPWAEARQRMGLRFESALTAALARAAEAPEHGPAVDAGVRRLFLEGFPYGVLYAAEPERVVVLAVMHLHRRPGYWRSR
jgi:plasmid stabilization system protein ParE